MIGPSRSMRKKQRIKAEKAGKSGSFVLQIGFEAHVLFANWFSLIARHFELGRYNCLLPNKIDAYFVSSVVLQAFCVMTTSVVLQTLSLNESAL